jgi:hypothetical protein
MKSSIKIYITSTYSYVNYSHHGLIISTYLLLESAYVKVANMTKLSRLLEVSGRGEQNTRLGPLLVRTLQSQCDLRQFQPLSLVQSLNGRVLLLDGFLPHPLAHLHLAYADQT